MVFISLFRRFLAIADSLGKVIQDIQSKSADYRDKLIILSNEDYFGYIKYFDKIVPSFGRLSVVPDYYETVERIFLSKQAKPKYLRVFQYRSHLVIAEEQRIEATPVFRDIQLKFLKNYFPHQSDLLKDGAVIHLIQIKEVLRGQDGYYPQNYPKYSIFNIQIDNKVKDYEQVNDFDKPGLYIFDKKRLLFVKPNKKQVTKPIVKQGE